MRRALALSTRAGEAVLGCGGTLAGLSAAGWELAVLSVADATRAGEEDAARHLGVAEVATLTVSAGPLDDAEALAAKVAAVLGPALDARHPARVFAPLETRDVLGAATAIALGWLDHPAPVVRFRTELLSAPPLPHETGIPIAAHLEAKVAACAALGIDEATVRERAAAEGRRFGLGGPAEALVEPPLDKRRLREQREEAEREERAALARLRASIARF